MVIKSCPQCQTSNQAIISNNKMTPQGVYIEVECGISCQLCSFIMTKKARPDTEAQLRSNVEKEQQHIMKIISEKWNVLSAETEQKPNIIV